ncbi:MAG: hypothetical protein JJW00_09465, partial [Sulfurimonas sp.]|nr:hypothetical protein [Sulfurimonas sp.]
MQVFYFSLPAFLFVFASIWGTELHSFDILDDSKFCYDYAYSQQGSYFTEKNDGSNNPKIVGDVVLDEPVEVKLFIKSLVDPKYEITDFILNITDINTSQASYLSNSVKITRADKLYPTALDDASDLNITTSSNMTSIKGVDVGDLSSNEHFFIYYSLKPKQRLDMPINIDASYNILTDLNRVIPRNIGISNIKMCSDANFAYKPAKGIFNIVHNSFYNIEIAGGTKANYNLPTQVTSREGDFKIISMDKINFDLLQGRGTIVDIEMIDATAYHDSSSACQDVTSSISDRISIIFDNNTTTSTMFDKLAIENAIGANNNISNSWEFYKTAGKNIAFRISYNLTNDINKSLITHTPDGHGNYRIDNFEELVQGIENCSQALKVPIGQTTTTTREVALACGNSGDFISAEHYRACQKCLYGYNTKLICSRDNFAIRPEAFMIHLSDQNQTNTALQTRLIAGESGATSTIINLASDYKYKLEVNATNHLNNNASYGYTKSFNTSTTDDIAKYIWEPRTTPLPLENTCNDDSNKTLDIRFVDGIVDANTTVDNVGEYRLSITDKTWTAVDNDPIYMQHHTGAHFASTLDCTPNSSKTFSVNTPIDFSDVSTLANTLTGCEIRSDHINHDNTLAYNDYNITFHPYKFDISNTLTIGLDSRAVTTQNKFVYMANIATNTDENESVHFNTFITPRGRDSTLALSNFTTGCFAKTIDINISKSSPINTKLTYRYTTHEVNSSNYITNYIPFATKRDANSTTTTDFFIKPMKGVLNIITNINFDRNQNRVANPENIIFTAIKVTDPRSTFHSDLKKSSKAEGNITLEQSITHYYGRTAARKARIVCESTPCVSGKNGEPNIFTYYEIYCFSETGSNSCDTSLLPLGSKQRVDSRWFTNLNHSESGDGNLSVTVEKTAHTSKVTLPLGVTNLNNYTKNSKHSYNGSIDELPYTATMYSKVANWLIYDEYD